MASKAQNAYSGGVASAQELDVARSYEGDLGTPEAKQFNEGPEQFHDLTQIVNADIGTQTRERVPSSYDRFTVTDRTREKYGIAETEDAVWIRRDNWRNLGEDRPGEFLDTNDGSRIPLDKTGKECFNRDYVLACRPKALVEQMERERNRAAQDFIKGIANAVPQPDEDEMLEMREEARRSLDMLLENSPTAGKSLEEAATIFSEQQTRDIADRYLYHGRTRPVPGVDAMRGENDKDRAVETIKSATAGRGRSHAMGAGFDANGRIVR